MLKKLGIFLALCLAIIFSINLVMAYINQPPDFSAIKDIAARKKAFVDYLKPTIDELNQQRGKERQELLLIYRNMQAGKAPDYWQRHQLKMWAERYDLKFKANKLETLAKKLLLHLDQIPTSMVLAQAAIESAWGTSRFVQIGNNFFGQWCFKKGCGMIPAARSEDAKHEVKNFDSPEESIATYFENINKHAAYKELRELRAQARKEGKTLSGLELVAGLENYSQRGEDYVEELRSVIRSNHFE